MMLKNIVAHSIQDSMILHPVRFFN